MTDRRMRDRRSHLVFSKYTFHDKRVIVCDGPVSDGRVIYDGQERRELSPIFQSLGSVSPHTEFFQGPGDWGPHTE